MWKESFRSSLKSRHPHEPKQGASSSEDEPDNLNILLLFYNY